MSGGLVMPGQINDAEFVYAGGAIDYVNQFKSHFWRHDLAFDGGVNVYCPVCANTDRPDDDTIMKRNEHALLLATRCVFMLNGLFTIGTPIEVATRVERRPPSTVCVIHGGYLGVFARQWKRAGVVFVSNLQEAIEWVSGS